MLLLEFDCNLMPMVDDHDNGDDDMIMVMTMMTHSNRC